MKANRAYHLTHTRGGREPAYFAARERHDLIEVVSIDEGEPILWWKLPAEEAGRLVRRLRADLAAMEAGEFLALWDGADAAEGEHGAPADRTQPVPFS
jgi:hypothetical protein